MAKILTSTQDFIDIVDIKDDTVILNGGRFRIVLETTSINFDLLSEAEQDAAIFAYANFVNSLDFPVQVVIKTRKIDISKYMDFLSAHEKNQPTFALKEQLQDYINFVKQLVVENTILAKKFYVVIPYWSLETQKQGLLDPIIEMFPWMKKQRVNLSSYSKTSFEDAKKTFEHRQEELGWQFRRLGIKLRRLTSPELVSLFYGFFNPESGASDSLKKDPGGFQTPFVKPATI